jgi:hypothetical protein
MHVDVCVCRGLLNQPHTLVKMTKEMRHMVQFDTLLLFIFAMKKQVLTGHVYFMTHLYGCLNKLHCRFNNPIHIIYK